MSAIGNRARVTALAALLLSHIAFAGDHGHGAHWGYEGHGAPEHWGDLGKEFATCKNGHQQSPINIDTRVAGGGAGAPVSVDYKPSPLKVVNNGHTIQVDYQPGSSITVGGMRYELVQFHFHAPSEHTIDGKAGDMVVHLVHKSAEGKLAVIGVLMDKGAENAELGKIWSHLPREAGHSEAKETTINASALLPADLRYYGYTGSLTTPPCTEGVSWMVLANRGSVSAGQVKAFTDIFPKSVRPVQPVHGRQVNLSR